MAKTDTQAEAAEKAQLNRVMTPDYPTIDVWNASGTHLAFFTENGAISCEATLYVENVGGDPAVRVASDKRIQRFRLDEALPPDLLAIASLVQAYLHNYACEKAGLL